MLFTSIALAEKTYETAKTVTEKISGEKKRREELEKRNKELEMRNQYLERQHRVEVARQVASSIDQRYDESRINDLKDREIRLRTEFTRLYSLAQMREYSRESYLLQAGQKLKMIQRLYYNSWTTVRLSGSKDILRKKYDDATDDFYRFRMRHPEIMIY